jgi:hypothetical protein
LLANIREGKKNILSLKTAKHKYTLQERQKKTHQNLMSYYLFSIEGQLIPILNDKNQSSCKKNNQQLIINHRMISESPQTYVDVSF